MKKIFSIICACALALTTMSSLVAAEDAAPEIKLVLNFSETGETLSDENYDPDLNFEDYYGAPVYKAELSIEGVAKKASVKENGTTVAYTGCIVDSIQTKFAYSADQDIQLISAALMSGALSKTTVAGEFTFSWSTATSAEMLKTDKAVIGTWYFISEDMNAITNMKIEGFPGYTHIGQINQYWDGTSKTETLKLAQFTPVIVAYPAATEPELPAARTAISNSFEAVVGDYVEITLTNKGTKTYALPSGVKGGSAKVAGMLKYTVNAEDANAPAKGDVFTGYVKNINDAEKANLILTETVK